MNPLLYSLIGLIAGAGMVAIIFALLRRGRTDDSEFLKRLETFDRAQERQEKMFRDEFARNREESSNVAKGNARNKCIARKRARDCRPALARIAEGQFAAVRSSQQ